MTQLPQEYIDDLTGYSEMSTWQYGEGQMIDKKVVESSRCVECGGKIEYKGYRSKTSYRAFAVCVKCGNCEEF